jgi:uncharacterized protein (TIGR00297 family)
MLYAAVAAGLAYVLRLLRLDGALAALVVGALVLEGGGLGMAVALLLFFCSSALLGLLARRVKRAAATAESDSGPRNAVQVLANGGPAALLCGLNFLEPSPSLLAGAIASLCAANADTWATELGVTFGKNPFRITTLTPSSAGPSGVVSVAGLIAAFAGAGFIAAASPLVGLTNAVGGLAVIGFGGAVLDSVLGDTIQRDERGRRGLPWITNDVVNLLSTCSAAAAGYFLL